MISKVIVMALAVAVSAAQQYGGGEPDGYKPGGYKPDEYKYPPQPYNFAYDSQDEFGATQFRKESGDGNGRISGSYGYKDEQGIERLVEYVADENGYRAQVKTNEPGTENKSPADIELYANPIVVNYVPKPRQERPLPYAAAGGQPSYAAAPQQPAPAPVPAYPGPSGGAYPGQTPPKPY